MTEASASVGPLLATALPALNNCKSNQHFVDATTFRYLTFLLHCSPLLYLNWFDSEILYCSFSIQVQHFAST